MKINTNLFLFNNCRNDGEYFGAHCPAFYDIVEIEVVKLDVVRVGEGREVDGDEGRRISRAQTRPRKAAAAAPDEGPAVKVRQMCGGQATPRGLPSHRPFARRRSGECAGGAGTTDGANE